MDEELELKANQMSKYKNQQAIEEFRKKFQDTWHGRDDFENDTNKRELEQFLDEQLTKKEEEVIGRVENLIKCQHCSSGRQDSMSGASECIHCGGDGHRLSGDFSEEHIGEILEQLKTQPKK